jgi:dimethylargininase
MTHPRITRALVRQPASTLAQGLTTQSRLGLPDQKATLKQHTTYCEALRSCGLDVTILPPDNRFPDGHFVEDAAVVFRDLAFICRSGAPAREPEGREIAEFLKHLHVKGIQGETGRLDGGDVLFCADRVLIGLSERTNMEGAEQLASSLRDVQDGLRVDFVHFRGMLHLKSGLSEIVPGVLVLAPALQMEQDLDFAEILILAPEDTYAANLVRINETLLIAAGFPRVSEIAERYYGVDNIIVLDMHEFRKMDGGLSCLSLRY